MTQLPARAPRYGVLFLPVLQRESHTGFLYPELEAGAGRELQGTAEVTLHGSTSPGLVVSLRIHHLLGPSHPMTPALGIPRERAGHLF